jgi:hypothetical protein
MISELLSANLAQPFMLKMVEGTCRYTFLADDRVLPCCGKSSG